MESKGVGAQGGPENAPENAPGDARGDQGRGDEGRGDEGRIDYAVHGHAAYITIANEAKRNAMSLALWRGVRDAVARAHADPDIRVMVLTGAGDKAFVSGADISEFDSTRDDPEAIAAYDRVVYGTCDAILEGPTPAIALIRGWCVGGGMQLAASCDIRVADDGARFILPPAKLGIGYPIDGLARLVSLMGPAVTAELIFTAGVMNAERALCEGFVNHVVPMDEIDGKVTGLVEAISGTAPLTHAAAKAALRALTLSPETRSHAEAMVRRCYDSEDYREGRAAFLEKRTPRFRAV